MRRAFRYIRWSLVLGCSALGCIVVEDRRGVPIYIVADAGEGGAPVSTGIVPANAIVGEQKDVFGGQVVSWAIVEGETVKELSVVLPLSTVGNVPPQGAD